MASDDELLEAIARDGTLDYSQWPGLFERILPRLEHIVYHEFPIPTIPLPAPLPPSINDGNKPDPSSADSSQKEDFHPDSPSTRPSRTSPLPFRPISNNSISAPPGTLPPPLVSLLSSIEITLKSSFSASPPHTAQRLAELLLRPRIHYRTLPSYLRALDRVISVSSPLSLFPLPSISSPSNTLANGLLPNGTSSPSTNPTSTSDPDAHNDDDDDDFVGGAALTPIPWLVNTPMDPNTTTTRPLPLPTNSDLRTESTSLIDGPNGSGSIETVSVTVNGISSFPSSSSSNPTTTTSRAGITQGELLRQEQEAGIVPVPASQHQRVTRSSSAAAANISRKEEEENSAVAATTGAANGGGEGEIEERVHARGPDVVGVEDMGPQARGAGSAAFDVEGAVGRRGEGEDMGVVEGGVGVGVMGSGGEDKGKDGGERDEDGDVVVADADGLPSAEEVRREKGAME